MGKKPNKREILLRETMCLENIGEGLTKDQNIDKLVTEFNITYDTAEKLYFDTTRKVAGLRDSTMEELKAQIICQMEILYKKSVSNRNYKTALDVLMSKAKVSGLLVQKGEEVKQVREMPKIIQVKEKDYS